MFEKIYIEKNLTANDTTKKQVDKITARFSHAEVFEIDNYRDVFGKFYKPYLEKRENLWLFLAHKKGQLLKEAPAAYGTKSGKHYYFVHAYNCIYECQYCYLQGYFNSPDIVLFLNYDEILKAIEEKILEHHLLFPNEEIWFHAGEFSDSLALSEFTGEIPLLYNLFEKYPMAKLELRTKSIKIKEILERRALSNVIISFSLSSEKNTKDIDLKTPPLRLKIEAIAKLMQQGHPIGLHFDPIVYTSTFESDYQNLVDDLFDYHEIRNNLELIKYISIGVVRSTKDVHYSIKKNYPDSKIFSEEMTSSFDGKIRYPKFMRYSIMHFLKKLIIDYGVNEELIYLCMEEGNQGESELSNELARELSESLQENK